MRAARAEAKLSFRNKVGDSLSNLKRIPGRPWLVCNFKEVLNSAGNDVRVELAHIGNSLCRLAYKILEAKSVTILGEKLFYIAFQEGVYLLYEQYPIGLFKVLKDKLLGQGPRGAQFEDANPLIHVQINHCVQTVHPPAATGDYQKLGFLWTTV